MDERTHRYRSHRDLKQCGGYVRGDTYRSRWYRGLGTNMEWLRLSLRCAGAVTVGVYTCEAPGEVWDETLAPALERAAGDLLLLGVRGRYLSFTVRPAHALLSYELSFPGRSIDALLPAAMQGNETLRRLLGVYQSLYMDTSRLRAELPSRLDPLGGDPLPGLGRWLGAERWLRGGLPAGKLLAAAPLLSRLRGTRRGLELLLEMSTGGRGTLVESFQWRKRVQSAAERADCARLYGGDGVTLLLPPDTPEEAVRFLREVLDDFVPLGVSWSIVRLEEGATLDGHGYLDVNMRLTEPPPARMDEAAADGVILE